MFLNTLSPAPGAKKKKFRVGRGQGSGNGKTAGKGHKGQKLAPVVTSVLVLKGGKPRFSVAFLSLVLLR